MTDDQKAKHWLESLEQLAFEPFVEPVDRHSIELWLSRWDLIEREFSEHSLITYRDRLLDTSDEIARARSRDFEGQVYPTLKTATTKLKGRFLDAIADFDLRFEYRFKALFESQVRSLTDVDSGIEGEIELILSELERLDDQFAVNLNGRSLTRTEQRDIMLRGSRVDRGAVWRSVRENELRQVEQYHQAASKILKLRQQIADQAGYQTFRQYHWNKPDDFDADQAQAFQKSVLVGVTPIIKRLTDHRRSVLGVDTLRPWDWQVGLPDAQAADNTWSGREVVERLKAGIRVYSPELAETIDSFPDATFELDRRPNKSNQGFSAYMPVSRHPFIFATYRGNGESLATLIHETGHSTHSQLMAANTPYVFDYYTSGSDGFTEAAAFFFELFTLEILAAPGCEIVPEAALRAIKRDKAMRLADRLQTLAGIEMLEHFMFGSHPSEVSASDITGYFSKIRSEYPDGIDFSGLEHFLPIRL